MNRGSVVRIGKSKSWREREMIVKQLQVLAFALSALLAQAALAQTPQDSPRPAASN